MNQRMKRKIYLVGFLADERLSEKTLQNYITRAIKHFHLSNKDDQATFDGVKTPERILVAEVNAGSALGDLKGAVKFFEVMDRIQGRK